MRNRVQGQRRQRGLSHDTDEGALAASWADERLKLLAAQFWAVAGRPR